MDKSDKYIKMCDCPEIQADKDGMRAIALKRRGEGRVMYRGNSVYVEGDVPSTTSATWHTIWLPRQDQLQEMAGMTNPHDWYSDVPSDDGYPIWDVQRDKNFTVHNAKTGEQFWLMIYMYFEHDLVWEKGKWQMKKFKCAKCGATVPEKDIFNVKRAGKMGLEFICRKCICSVIGKPKKKQVIQKFATKVIKNTEDINPKYAKLANKHFWDLI